MREATPIAGVLRVFIFILAKRHQRGGRTFHEASAKRRRKEACAFQTPSRFLPAMSRTPCRDHDYGAMATLEFTTPGNGRLQISAPVWALSA